MSDNVVFNPELAVVASVSIVCDDLTDVELSAMYMAMSWNTGSPKGVYGYEKMKSLFTENDGTKMHELTRNAFLNYCNKKFS